MRDFLKLMATVFESGVGAGQFRQDADPRQFAHDVYAVMLGYHHASRLLKDPAAEARAFAGFENLLASARPPRQRGRHGARPS